MPQEKAVDEQGAVLSIAEEKSLWKGAEEMQT